jgi:hypothetical protein
MRSLFWDNETNVHMTNSACFGKNGICSIGIVKYWQAGVSAGLKHGMPAPLSFKDAHFERM